MREQQPSKPSATYQDILDLPETLVGEIINGWLVTHPRMDGKALLAKERLGGVLAHHFCKVSPAQASVDEKPE
ncbi:MAG: hypothetical protein Q8O79_00620 [Pseudomonadota bacterium]|nr:hypothetical protein [Pseudomonadota bacterium]